ncbi:MAG: peptidoglycan-N-acetylglucosamine deacetylase [Verrucomicrobiaceae bacterium]|nr:peptidoglycan-N-acetylglucosamine deacetylase [Verrucomicrobiaceae bacterium]
MYLSIWIGIMMGASQSGCSVVSAPANDPPQAVQAAPNSPPPSVGSITNPDSPLPKVPAPGMKVRYNSVHTDQMVLAMTFDDGPHPVNTPKLLDLLKARNIKATFFLVGERVKMHPEIVRRILAEGHEVANHTWTHPSLVSISDEKIRSEFQRTADAIWDAAQYRPHLMRPPFGATNKRIEQWVYNEFGYSSITWSVDPNDWRRPGVQVVANRLIAGAHKGAIMLSHDIHAPTIEAMPQVFDTLLAKGYKFLTVSQLINLEQQSAPVGVIVTPESEQEAKSAESKAARPKQSGKNRKAS